jgi:hypothetical protein
MRLAGTRQAADDDETEPCHGALTFRLRTYAPRPLTGREIRDAADAAVSPSSQWLALALMAYQSYGRAKSHSTTGWQSRRATQWRRIDSRTT